MSFVRCPVCEDILSLGTTLGLDQPITCSTCLSNLKIVSLDPVELEEAARRPLRPMRQNFQPRPSGGYPGANRPGGYSAHAYPPRDRRPPTPYLPPVPPNPDKLVNGKRAQKWERPKDEVDEPEVDDYNEFEDKLARQRGGKGKRGK